MIKFQVDKGQSLESRSWITDQRGCEQLEIVDGYLATMKVERLQGWMIRERSSEQSIAGFIDIP